MTDLQPGIRLTRHPDATESRLGTETVILHLGSGTYFGLDAVGTIVWDLLQDGGTPEDICMDVRKAFPDVIDPIEPDVMAFLAQLVQHNLVAPT